MSQFTNPKCLTLTPVSKMKIYPSLPSIPKSQIPNPNPNPNFRNQDLFAVEFTDENTHTAIYLAHINE